MLAGAAPSRPSFATSSGAAKARPSIARPPRAIALVHQVLTDIAAAGDVDAPIGVVVGA